MTDYLQTVVFVLASAVNVDVPIPIQKQVAFTPSASVTLDYLGGDGVRRKKAITSGTRYTFPVRTIYSTTSANVQLEFEVGSNFEG